MTLTEVANSHQAVEYVASSVASDVYVVGGKPSHTGSASITVLPAYGDPIGDVAAAVQDAKQPVAVLSSIETLFNGLGHFNALASKPVVFHAQVGADYGLVSALRHAGFVFLQSFGPEDAQDIVVAAHLIAHMLGKPVVHFYENVERTVPIRWTPEEIGAAVANAVVPADTVEVAEEEQKQEANGEVPDESSVAKPPSVDDAVSKALGIVSHQPFEYRGAADATEAFVVLGSSDELSQAAAKNGHVGLLFIRVYQPFLAGELLAALPKTVSRIALLEQIAEPTTTWLPLVQDVLTAPAESLAGFSTVVAYQLGLLDASSAETAVKSILDNLKSEQPKQGLLVGDKIEPTKQEVDLVHAEAAIESESAYLKVLRQLFPALDLLNSPDQASAGLPTVPEYGFGAFLAQARARDAELRTVQANIKANKYDVKLASLLSKWLVGDRSAELGEEIQILIDSTGADISKDLFKSHTPWLIGSDAWAYDLGASGVHHVLASGKNVNMLVIDSKPQSAVSNSRQRKKDIGLYAMSFGDVYVASVAVYSSYTQLLQALLEAAAFDGPSVVVAYLPYEGTSDALKVLQETKKAVDTGYWPLYRYNPANEKQDKEVFTLDSYTIRKSLQAFLDRENKLTLLSAKTPRLARDLTSSYGADVRRKQLASARDAYAKLLEGLSGPPLLVLFASDGGQAENVARRLARRAKGRGLKATVAAFDDVEADDLIKEQNVVFVTSTAGQGEFPQNGRNLWEALKGGDYDLSGVKIGVFGMGDSQYWPRKQDKHYYNKPSHDLWARIKLLGAQELVELGQGDDQDADGWSTGYNAWEPQVWEALGVAGVAGADEPPPRTNEDIKIESNFLRGTIAEGLKDLSTGAISADDQQLTKFHGIYMQDDRDVRDERKAEGLEPAYSFMVRVRLPGCVATPEQWLRIDELSDRRGNGTFKITTRGTFQLHGVIKENLKPAIRGMNAVLMDTVAACGDVDRNVVAAALPQNAAVHRQVYEVCDSISEHLLPRTTAYYEIWLEGQDEGDGPGYAEAWDNRKAGCTKITKKELVSKSAIEDVEPLYTPVYLPRKFKINVAVPPYNDVDVYGHDIGLIAIVENDKDVVGFNVLVGGGMGTTHNNKKTYPRTGSLIGFAPKDKINDVCEKVMLVQRDNGDRTNRKHARLKYTVDDMTVPGFKAAVEEYLGYALEEPREHPAFKTNVDTYGWIRDEEGFNHFTTFVENGRVEDTPELQFRKGFRAIANYIKGSKGEFRLTANQHILVANISDEQLPKVKELLAQYKLDNVSFSGLRLSSAACVAFPTCGLAMAESERYLPKLVDKLELALEEYGLRHDSVVMRMTGCPNGCARPWLAEVALVGKAYGAYNLMLGGGHVGQRLNKLYRSSLKEEEILDTLKPMFKQWSLERHEGEPFGDFVVRKGIISAVREGKDWWENVEPGLE